MQALYQSKLDNFCAFYAVLNGLKLVCDVNSLQAKVLLNEALFFEAQNPNNWLEVLNHETTYHNAVKRMLSRWASVFDYTHYCPFESFDDKEAPEKDYSQINYKNPEHSKEEVWGELMRNCIAGKKTVVFRFCRFLPGKIGPYVDHWTTLRAIDEEAMHFFDCSLEPTGWYTIPKNRLFIAPLGSLPAQSVGIKRGLTLNIDKQEFAIIPPEHIHVIQR